MTFFCTRPLALELPRAIGIHVQRRNYVDCITCIVVVVLLFYVHGKHLRSCRDGQLT